MLAERTGLAYIPQAAESLARDSLRVRTRVPHSGNTPDYFMLAERTGLEPATPDVTGRYSNQLNYHS
jgi:hypothetical protein